MRRLALLATVLLLAWPAAAQEAATTLTLEEAVVRARAEGPSARQARLAFEAAEYRERAVAVSYRPTLSLTGSAPGLERSITAIQQDDGSLAFVPQNRLSSTARLRVGQALPYTGGELFISSELGRIDVFGGNDFQQWQAAPLVVGLEQPILAFNPRKWQRRVEPLRLEAARRSYLEAQESASEETVQAFFGVVLAEAEREAAQFNVMVNDTIYALSQGRYHIGRIAENELLQSELALLNAQAALAEARLARDRALDALRLVLDLAPGAPLEIVPPEVPPLMALDPDVAVQQAASRRSAFTELELDRVEAERDVAQARRSVGFNLAATASFGLDQSDTDLPDAYRDLNDQQRADLRFTLPLWTWGQNRAQVQAARVSARQVAEAADRRQRELQQEVRYEAQRLLLLQRQLDLAAKADTVATRRFEVARGRYRLGTIDITDLFDAQQAKDSARLSYVRTLREAWAAVYRVRRLTLYDFAAGQPVR